MAWWTRLPECSSRAPAVTLEISDQELLAALQQVWGEELHSNSSLTTRVTNGQFSNIAGRMNALRLGGASGAVGGRGDLPGIGSIKSHRFADDQLSFYSG